MSRLDKRKKAPKQIRHPRGGFQVQEEGTFRRSRTLTGSTSSGVKAAIEKKAELKSERIKKHALKKTRKSIAAVLLILLVSLSGIYYLVYQYSLSVEVASFSPSLKDTPSASVYEKTISDYLAVRPSERFRFALNQKNLSNYTQQQFPEVKNVTLEGGSLGKARFDIELRQPVARWQINGKQFFVDMTGESFEKNYFAVPAVNVTDRSGAVAQAGSATLASRGLLRFLGRLVALTNASGLGQVKEASLPPGMTREIDIRLEGRGYLVKTHIDRDPASEVEDLRRTITYLEERKISPTYIDLRVQGKAFYR